MAGTIADVLLVLALAVVGLAVLWLSYRHRRSERGRWADLLDAMHRSRERRPRRERER